MRGSGVGQSVGHSCSGGRAACSIDGELPWCPRHLVCGWCPHIAHTERAVSELGMLLGEMPPSCILAGRIGRNAPGHGPRRARRTAVRAAGDQIGPPPPGTEQSQTYTHLTDTRSGLLTHTGANQSPREPCALRIFGAAVNEQETSRTRNRTTSTEHTHRK